MARRILVCSQQYTSEGGVSMVVNALNKSWAQLGYQVDMMAPTFSGTMRISFPIHSPNLPGLLGILPFWQIASLKINRISGDYDLVVLHQPVIPGQEFPPRGTRTLAIYHVTVAGYYLAYRRMKLGRLGLYYSAYSALERRTVRTLSQNHDRLRFVGVSPSVADELRTMSATEDIRTIPNSVSEPTSRVPKSVARGIIRTEYGIQIEDEDLLLLTVGRMDVQKQPLLVLQLCSLLQRSVARLKLLMVGHGALAAKVAARASRVRGVSYLGFVGDSHLFSSLHCAADAFVSLSAYEGLPLAVLEASRYGLPCILSDISPHRWLVDCGFANGITVDATRLTDELDSVRRFLFSTLNKYENGSGDARRFQDWQDVAKNYLSTAGLPFTLA